MTCTQKLLNITLRPEASTRLKLKKKPSRAIIHVSWLNIADPEGPSLFPSSGSDNQTLMMWTEKVPETSTIFKHLT
jgi:hypothetical protein